MQIRLLTHDPNSTLKVFRIAEVSGLQWLEMATGATMAIPYEAAGRQERYELSGADGDSPYAETMAALEELERVVPRLKAELQALMSHAHTWNDNEYCRVCGADGRA